LTDWWGSEDEGEEEAVEWGQTKEGQEAVKFKASMQTARKSGRAR
jgi:hypothetical protein